MNAMKISSPMVRCILLAGMAVAAALPISAQTTNRPSGRPEFSAFKLVTDRNIFDLTRTGSSSSRPRETSTRTRRVEYVTLVGVMDYEEKGPLAFFDGSRSDYRKVLKPLEVIAGYKVAEVGTSYVKLASGTNEFSLPVGMQLRREDEGNWHVSEPAYVASSSSSSSSYDRSDRGSSSRYGSSPPSFSRSFTPGPPPTTMETNVVMLDPNSQAMMLDLQADVFDTNAPPEAAAGGGGGGETDPVLLRLMQRRAQEVNR